MKKNKKFLIIFFVIMIPFWFLFFLLFEKNTEKNGIKNEEKSISKSEEKNKNNQVDLKEKTEDMYENFDRGKERYTERNIIYQTNAKLISLDSTDICKEIGCDPYTLKEYLTAFSLKRQLTCNSGKILDYCYAQMEDATRKIYIFIQLDDTKQTLATAIFEPATSDAAAYYDVLPCQYSLEQIKEQAWYEKEEQ